MRLTAIAAAAYALELLEAGVNDAPQPTRQRHRLSASAEVAFRAVQYGFELAVGGRFEHSAASVLGGADVVAGGVEGGAEVGAGGGSAHVRLRLQLNAWFEAQASYSQQLRLPSLYELFGNSGYVLGNLALVPEVARTASLRLKAAAQVAHGVVQAEAGGFFQWADQLIHFVQNSQNVIVPRNLSRAELAGLEVGGFADLFGHLRLRLSLAALQAIDRSQTVATRGKQLPLRPPLTAYASIGGYAPLTLGPLTEVSATIDFAYQSHNYADPANLVRFADRYLLGVSLSLTLGRAWHLGLDVRNVAGSRVQDVVGFPLPGTRLMATLGWRPML